MFGIRPSVTTTPKMVSRSRADRELGSRASAPLRPVTANTRCTVSDALHHPKAERGTLVGAPLAFRLGQESTFGSVHPQVVCCGEWSGNTREDPNGAPTRPARSGDALQ